MGRHFPVEFEPESILKKNLKNDAINYKKVQKTAPASVCGARGVGKGRMDEGYSKDELWGVCTLRAYEQLSSQKWGEVDATPSLVTPSVQPPLLFCGVSRFRILNPTLPNSC